MSDKSHSKSSLGKSALDPNFVETIRLLHELKIPYWICHGTLLGIIRDGHLIPWDHDIDIAIWAEEISKETIVDLMTSKGYTLKDYGADYDLVAFTKEGGREVDFNLYRISESQDMAFSEWYVSKSRLMNLLELIAERAEYHGKFKVMIRGLFVLSPGVAVIVRFLKQKNWFYKSAGYTTPSNLLREFEVLENSGLRIRVPSCYEAILEFVYGPKWRVPKQQYDWKKESPSTRISSRRFT